MVHSTSVLVYLPIMIYYVIFSSGIRSFILLEYRFFNLLANPWSLSQLIGVTRSAFAVSIFACVVILFSVFQKFTPVTSIVHYFGLFSITLLIHTATVHRRFVRATSRSALIIFLAIFATALYNESLVFDPLNISNQKQ